MALTIKITWESDNKGWYQDDYDSGVEKIGNYYDDEVHSNNCNMVVIANGDELRKCCKILGREFPNFNPSLKRTVSFAESNPFLTLDQFQEAAKAAKEIEEHSHTFFGGAAKEIIYHWNKWVF